MTGKIRHYFAAGHTARGFYNLIDSALENLDHIYLLGGAPGTGKSTLINKINENMRQRGYDTELIHCASDNDALDGIIIPQLHVGVIDEAVSPETLKRKEPNGMIAHVNLDATWNPSHMLPHQEEIITLRRQMKTSLQRAYDSFAEALSIHDNELEQLYFDHLDLTKANALTQQLITQFFPEDVWSKRSTVYRRFLGAATPQGPVDFIQNLTDPIRHRYFVKGPPGCGKSHMMKKIAEEAQTRGIDTEVYHCGFDPHSLDMLLFPELDIAIFDSTDPHEHFPQREEDQTIDMDAYAITPGTDEKYSDEITAIHARYKGKMKEGTTYLAEAKAARDKIKIIYLEAIERGKQKHIQQKIQDDIVAIANENR